MAAAMGNLLAVMAGGAIGAGLRYELGAGVVRWFGASAWPAGTLAANLIGALAMGVLAGVGERHGLAEGWRLFLGTGLLGGFTTFSAFSLENVRLIEAGDWTAAFAYAAISVIGTAMLVGIGLWSARAW